MEWTYQGKIVQQLPADCEGFVYLITNTTNNRKYVGKKLAKFKTTKPPLKGKKNKRRGTKESDWRDYFGSQKEIVALAKKDKTQDNWEKRILEYVPNKKLLTYYETKHLFINNVLEDDYSSHINDNILGKFYRKDFK